MWFRRRHSESTEEAAKALRDAEINLAKIQDRSHEVTTESSISKAFRERNHFAEAMEVIIRRNKGIANDGA